MSPTLLQYLTARKCKHLINIGKTSDHSRGQGREAFPQVLEGLVSLQWKYGIQYYPATHAPAIQLWSD